MGIKGGIVMQGYIEAVEAKEERARKCTAACAGIEDPKKTIDRMRDALSRISYAKPDRLDHSLDVAIIERAASAAKQALGFTR